MIILGVLSLLDLIICLLIVVAREYVLWYWNQLKLNQTSLTSWLSFVVSSVSLSLSHWYPGSGVVLDCIDS